ncbi:FKBP-type peptidyl-prolyl cis-trans isomerase [Leifsonia sp. YAF41]|uniref:FKBP-type peptidyl-prolyl cis-trans isomerase n=1 Tax=Leifsonia sp. YAF41 TaxID=3233086 RepID=UPI003F9E31EA
MRKLPVLLVIAGAALALTGCSSTVSNPSADSKTASSAECTAPGKISDSVKVTGDFGTSPKVTFKTPLASPKSTERSVVVEGKGKEVAKTGSVLDVSYTAYNATTGKTIDTTEYGADAKATQLSVDKTKYIAGLVAAVNCSVSGDRVVAVMPPADGFGTEGSSGFGIGAKDSMIFVIDVNKVSAPPVVLAKANGADVKPEAGLPTVKLAKDGAPTITIPKTDPPAELKIAPLKKGDGAVVGEGDTVSVEYTGVIWASGKTFDSSWKTEGATSFPTSGVIPGFGKALVGQTVGSQVMAVIPPGDGYGAAGVPNAGIGGTDTLVFVVDILGTTPAAK